MSTARTISQRTQFDAVADLQAALPIVLPIIREHVHYSHARQNDCFTITFDMLV